MLCRHIEEKKGRKVAVLVNADRDLWTSPTEKEKRTTGVSRWRTTLAFAKVQDDMIYEAKESWVTMEVDDDNTVRIISPGNNLKQTSANRRINAGFKGTSQDRQMRCSDEEHRKRKYQIS